MAHVVRTTEEVVPDSSEGSVNSGQNYLQRVVYFVVSVIEALLVIRLLLALFGANSNNVFASFIYGITYPFVQPFIGLFAVSAQLGVSRLEVETLAAIVVVALLGWVLTAMFGLGKRNQA